MTTVERAYQLAGSGECRTVSDVRTRLAAEGYELVGPHLTGPTIRNQLRKLCEASWAEQNHPAE